MTPEEVAARAKVLKSMRGRNFLLAGALSMAAIGIAAFTMHSISGRDFSDIDESGNKIEQR